MFRTVPLSIIRSFSLYTQQWDTSYRFADSLRAGLGRNSVLILLVGAELVHADTDRQDEANKFL